MIILTSLLITAINDKRQGLAYFSPKAQPKAYFSTFFLKACEMSTRPIYSKFFCIYQAARHLSRHARGL